MVYRILSVLVLLTVQSLAKFSDKDFDEWTRQIGPPSTGQVDKCKKDLLILLDVSFSIGESTFNKEIKPFLNELVEHPKLNVNPTGTQIAMVVFSQTDKTMELLKFGDKLTQKDLKAYFSSDDFTWNKLSGDRTRTGLALQMTNTDIFTKSSPENARPKIADVVMLITDGEPRGPKGVAKETSLAYAEAQTLRDDKDVLIVGIAIGGQKDKFKHVIVKITGSEENTFDAEFDKLDDILDKVVDKSCNAAACSLKCSDTEGVFFAKKHNEGIRVLMPPPEVVQESNRPGVCPPVPSPLPGPPGPPAPPAPPPPLGAVYKYHGVGSHTSVLKYLYLGNEVTCSTKVTVKVKCGETIYDPDLKTCCCGKLWRKQKVGEKCCGNQLIDTRVYYCCDEKIASIVSHGPTGCYYTN